MELEKKCLGGTCLKDDRNDEKSKQIATLILFIFLFCKKVFCRRNKHKENNNNNKTAFPKEFYSSNLFMMSCSKNVPFKY